MLTGTHDVGVIRRIRHAVESDRRGTRPDVARELSIAITALEDAEMRLARALIRQSRHAADAEKALDAVPDQVLAHEPVEGDEIEETTEKEGKQK